MRLFLTDTHDISKNFNAGEYIFASHSDEDKNYIDFDSRLVAISQRLREILSKAITINSLYRNYSYNKSIGGVSDSQHIIGKAIDLSGNGLVSLIKNAIETENEIYQELLKMGVRGFGVYDNFIHLDFRTNLTIWGNVKKKQ